MDASSRLRVFDPRSPRPLPMTVERHHRQRDRRSGNPGYEARLNEALGYVASGEFKSLRQAAKARGVAKSTLSDRAKGRHISFEKASQARQTLTPEEEQTLLDWCRQRAQESRPWSPQELESNPRFSGLYPKPTQPRRRQARTSHDESLPGVSNNPPLNNEAQLASLNPSIHPPPQNHHHTPSHSPPLSVPQHPFGQPLPPFNPYAHFAPYQMSYNHPYHYPPAHVYCWRPQRDAYYQHPRS